MSRKSHWFALNDLYEQLRHLGQLSTKKTPLPTQHGESWHAAAPCEGCRGKALLAKTVLISPFEWRDIWTTPSPGGQVHCGSCERLAPSLIPFWVLWKSLPMFMWRRTGAMPSQGPTSVSTCSSIPCMWPRLLTARIAILMFCLLLRLSRRLF